ncbi:hypothetical protein DPMN_063560 [Dreissena polymorpha]|uniref:Uncharacterized protein n=1 Tax=Dreissena polymorpha TaxID=45954 RepID=A0A9D4CAR0_DREPO|nr:hypothetical protein DPMN_063560 [Dreissena polymorpha]
MKNTDGVMRTPPLVQACFHGDPDEVRALLYKKEDVNYQKQFLVFEDPENTPNRTPLHSAAYCGEHEIADLLIMNGARVNTKDNKWLTPLHRACCSKSEETVKVLLKHQADVNARDKNWQTPLHVAAANNAVRCAEALIPLLTNVNVSDRGGRTSLHHAAFNGHKEVCA